MAGRARARLIDEATALRHAVFYYWTPGALDDLIADIFRRTSRDGAFPVLIGDPGRRRDRVAALRARGFDFEALEASGRAATFDQGRVFSGTRADLEGAADVLGAIGRAMAAIGTRRFALVGLGAGAACAQGATRACLEIEGFWGRAAAEAPGSHVLCPYGIEDFGGEIAPELVGPVNAAHEGILVEDAHGQISVSRY